MHPPFQRNSSGAPDEPIAFNIMRLFAFEFKFGRSPVNLINRRKFKHDHALHLILGGDKPNQTENLIATFTQLYNTGATKVTLLLSTGGGSVMHGITIYNTLRALPLHITTHNVGNVDSIGNVIFLAGENRFACPHSTFMFHGVGRDLVSPTRLETKMLTECMNGIDSDHKRIGSIIGEHTSLQAGDITQLFTEARTKDADWAQSTGFIEAIREPKIPVGVPVHALVFSR